MGKRGWVVSFSLVFFIAFDTYFAAQVEAASEKDKPLVRKTDASRPRRRYAWKTNIVTTLFCIVEQQCGQNLVPNCTSAVDKERTKIYGGACGRNPAQ